MWSDAWVQIPSGKSPLQRWDIHWHLKITQLWCQMQLLSLKSAPGPTSRENIQILKDFSPELKKVSIIIWQQEIWHPLCMFPLLEGMNIRPASKTHVCRNPVTKSVPWGEAVVFLPNIPWSILIYQWKILIKNRGKNVDPISIKTSL